MIEKAVQPGSYAWADFGSGDGAFTLALRDLGGPEIEIFSVDTDRGRLSRQRTLFEQVYPDSRITFLKADFTEPLKLPPLDGILMANSLHYVDKQPDFLQRIRAYLKPAGKLLIIEYDTDTGNAYVPYPLSQKSLRLLAEHAGFTPPELLATTPSRYWGTMYAVLATPHVTYPGI